MPEIKVAEWISHGEADRFDEDDNLGGWGGWFGVERGKEEAEHDRVSHRWKDFIDGVEEEFHPHFEALRRDVVARGIRGGGSWHQYDDAGVPVFSDGAYITCTMRGWGDIMAAIWAEEDDQDYTYVDFAWS